MPILPRNIARSLALAAFASACSGSDDDPGSGDSCMAPPVPSQSTLCKLELGSSTKDDARKLLGTPTTTTESESLSRFLYIFGNLCSSPVSVTLFFDQTDTFDEASTSNLILPECWKPNTPE